MRGLKEVRVDIGGKKYLISSDDDYLEHIGNRFEPRMVKLLSHWRAAVRLFWILAPT